MLEVHRAIDLVTTKIGAEGEQLYGCQRQIVLPDVRLNLAVETAVGHRSIGTKGRASIARTPALKQHIPAFARLQPVIGAYHLLRKVVLVAEVRIELGVSPGLGGEKLELAGIFEAVSEARIERCVVIAVEVRFVQWHAELDDGLARVDARGAKPAGAEVVPVAVVPTGDAGRDIACVLATHAHFRASCRRTLA